MRAINADRFKRYRMKKMLTISELSRLTGLSTTTIRELESGTREPTMRTLRKLLFEGFEITIKDALKIGLLS